MEKFDPKYVFNANGFILQMLTKRCKGFNHEKRLGGEHSKIM